uniref:DUF202 domain-containing protein n=1 Tax=Macrostomum lignano TaxID=282301 RepID=A0A1I8FI80_9PLAT
ILAEFEYRKFRIDRIPRLNIDHVQALHATAAGCICRCILIVTNIGGHYAAASKRCLTSLRQYMKLNAVFYALGGILGYEALLIAGAIIIHRASDDSNKVKPQ